ncbi:SDR family NAD(P)-dependent oxidoreductase [Shimia ponticola]|uniref:SDR family NAD(P)-dependent oxidoreductase n=1 Tax=Shimia ponticola TaxID=2582893 RepID=UPI0011BE124D|nr:SDR family NAD(P)-dependent oxidoreductase [Shimia ponticola]
MTRAWAGKRYWLVGASEGLGRSLAHVMSRAGVEVIVSARSQDRLDELVAELPGKAEAVAVDITDQDSVDQAKEAIGEVDGIVFLAGVYWPMSSKKWDVEKATAMADINFVGAFRSLGAVMPQFLERGTGHVVLTGSLSGFRGLPKTVGYGATKAGIMYLAEGMHADLRNTDIDVQVVNPGFIKTRLTDKNDFKMPFIMEPEEAAQLFFEHMGTDTFKRSFPRAFSYFFRLSQFLPDWLYYRIFA